MPTPHPSHQLFPTVQAPDLAPADIHALAAWLTAEDWPVLPESADFLAIAAQTPGLEDAHTLAEHVDQDPLLVLKVLAYGARLQRQAGREPSAQTPLECVLLAGVEPFLREFADQTACSDADHQPGDEDRGAFNAPAELESLLLRTRRAAAITRAVSIAKQDTQSARMYTAAQLHSAPALLLALRSGRAPCLGTTRSGAGIDEPLGPHPLKSEQMLDDLRQALLEHFQLPQMLQQLLRAPKDGIGENKPRLILLAHQIAALGLERLSTPEGEPLVQQMAQLLAQPIEETRQQLMVLCEDN